MDPGEEKSPAPLELYPPDPCAAAMVGYDERRVGDLRGLVATVADWPDVEERTVDGCPAFAVAGELFALVSDQGVSITALSPGARAELEAAVPVSAFEAEDRAAEGWATVPPESAAPEVLAPFLRASYEAALAAAEG